jgi:glycosyltransferase involved in cell wall biosynthesis
VLSEDNSQRASPGRPESPLLSVVTIVRNGEKTLARAIASVRRQDIPGLEYIVIDGGSTDGTIDIIRANADIISFWVSEPDRGISDGFNKGISRARGKYVQLLNADDWLSPGQLAFGLETLETTGADFVFGDLLYHDQDEGSLYCVSGDPDYAESIARIMPPLNHPTVIVRRAVYERHGLFDIGLRFAMDYEFLLRIHRAGCRGVYDPRMQGHMGLEGVSDSNASAALRESRDIAIRHGYPRFRAHIEFCYRLLKGKVRRSLERLFPRAVSVTLRSLFNRSITYKKDRG